MRSIGLLSSARFRSNLAARSCRSFLNPRWSCPVEPCVRTVYHISRPCLMRMEDLPKEMLEYEKRLRRDSAVSTRGVNAGLGVLTAFGLFYIYNCLGDITSGFHDVFAMVMRRLPPETARSWMVKFSSWGFAPTDYEREDPYLITQLTDDVRVLNPIGLAAGFDREARASGAFCSMGFGFVEVGTVGGSGTADCQRATRNADGRGITYQQGSGSDLATVKQNLENDSLRYDRAHLASRGVLGVSVAGGTAEVVKSIRTLGPYANYVAVQASTSLERPLKREMLNPFLWDAVEAASKVGNGCPLFLKVPIDLSESEREVVTSVSLEIAAKNLLFKGLIVGEGGLEDGEIVAGPELSQPSLLFLADVYRRTEGKLMIIASGGVKSGADALDRIEAGASYVQLYSGLLHDGPPIARRVKTELSHLMYKEGYKCIEDAIGAAHKVKKPQAQVKKRKAKGHLL